MGRLFIKKKKVGTMKGLNLLFNISAIAVLIVSIMAYIKIKFGKKERECSKENLSLRPINSIKKENMNLHKCKNVKAA